MKKNKVIHFGFLIIAFVFFSNPNVNIIDVLPDAIGCLLIAFAIGKLAYLCDRIRDAQSAFYTLFWITVSKIPALVVLLSIVGSNVNEGTMWLLFSFSYAVIETVFAIRAWNALFEGIAYLGSRSDGGEFVFIPTKKEVNENGGNLRFDMLKHFTVLLVLVKAVASTVPEFLYIYPQDYINVSAFDILEYKPLLTVLCATVSLLFGLLWLVCISAYSVYLAKHRAFWSALTERYNEKTVLKKGLFIMRGVKIFAAVITVALLLSADFYADEYNYIPDFLSAIVFFAGAFVIDKYSGGAAALKISSVIYFATATLTFVTMILFKTDCFSPVGYSYVNVHSSANAARLYNYYATANAVNQIAFLAVIFSLCPILKRIVRMHTGFDTLSGTSNSSRSLERVYSARIMRVRIMSVFTALTSIAYFGLIVYFERVETRVGYEYMPTYSLIWMLDLLVAAIFAVYTSNVINNILDEVNYKYRYE